MLDIQNGVSRTYAHVSRAEACAMFQKSWPNIMAISCVVVVAIIEAVEQAISQSPHLASKLPRINGVWHYLPLGLLVIAALIWVSRQIFQEPSVPSDQKQRKSTDPLREKTHQLGCDLFAFLREKGPPPFPEVAYGRGDMEFSEYRKRRNAFDLLKKKDPSAAEKALTANEQWVDSIYYGYTRLFQNRVKDLLHEVAESGVDSMSGGWDDLHENELSQVGPERAKKIANHVLRLAARIEARTISSAAK